MRRLCLVFLLTLLAAVASSQQDPQKYVDSAKLCLHNNMDDTAKVLALFGIVDKMTDYGEDLDTIIKYGNLGIDAARRVNDTVMEGRFHWLESWGYIYAGDPKSLDCLFRALQLFESCHSTKYKGRTLRDICAAYTNMFLYTEAFDYCHATIDFCSQAGDSVNLADAYENIAVLNYNLQIFDISKQYYQKALEIAKKINKPLNVARAQFRASLAEYHSATTPDEEFESIRKSQELYKIYIGYYYDMANNHYALANQMLKTYPKLTDKAKRDTLEQWITYWLTSKGPKVEDYVAHYVYTANMKFAMIKNNKRKAALYADSLLSIIDSHNNNSKYDSYEALKEYYIWAGNYKMAYSCHEQGRKILYSVMNVDLSANNEKSLVQRSYEAAMHEQDLAKKERDMQFELTILLYQTLQNCIIVLVIIALLIAATLLRQFMLSRKENKSLSAQNELILGYTSRLESLMKTVSEQRDEIAGQAKSLGEQRKTLLKANKQLLKSLNYAQGIQQAITASEDRLREIFPDSFMVWQPRDIVSGDFCWTLQSEGRKYVATADCTGHGVPGALLSMLGCSILNDISFYMSGLTAGDILDIMKRRIEESLSRNTQNITDGMDICIYIVEADTLQFAGAKRPLILVRDGRITEYKPDRIGIGLDVFHRKISYKTSYINTEPGDMVYTFTDGITDQGGGEGGVTKYGMSQLRELLADISSQDSETQKSLIHQSISRWLTTAPLINSTKQIDDILVVGVRV